MSLVVVPRDERTLIVMRASVSRRPIPPSKPLPLRREYVGRRRHLVNLGVALSED
jgi:hypothetical protein